MDTEQLKLIIEMLSTISGDTSNAVIAYFIYKTIIELIWVCVVFLGLKGCAVAIYKCSRAYNDMDELRQKLGVGPHDYEYESRHRISLLRKIDTLITLHGDKV